MNVAERVEAFLLLHRRLTSGQVLTAQEQHLHERLRQELQADLTQQTR
jgi:hypothetical protein